MVEYRLPGSPVDEIWQVWMDAAGAGRWTASSRQWPIEQLEQLAERAGLSVAPAREGTKSPREIAALHPGAASWWTLNIVWVSVLATVALGLAVAVLL